LPSYEFRCPECKFKREFFQKKVIDHRTEPCPKCSGTMEIEPYSPMLGRSSDILKPGKLDRYIEERGFCNEKAEYHFNDQPPVE